MRRLWEQRREALAPTLGAETTRRIDAAYARGDGELRAEIGAMLVEHDNEIARIFLREMHLRVALAFAQRIGRERAEQLITPDDEGASGESTHYDPEAGLGQARSDTTGGHE